jgi:beta-glucosidase
LWLLGKPVVLVLQNGRPLSIGWAKDHVPAILEAWYPGEFGGQAIAETLFGDNNPGGRLTVSFPRDVGQLPDFYNYDPSRTHRYVEGNDRPLFPFGFGLSYTTFSYDHLAVQPPAPGSKGDIQITVDVTNTGTKDGDEVAQLYLRENVSSVETPNRSLEGFSRIHLKPQETKTVTFHVPQQQIALWNAEGQWAVESGKYTAWVGGSSQATLTTTFQLNP